MRPIPKVFRRLPLPLGFRSISLSQLQDIVVSTEARYGFKLIKGQIERCETTAQIKRQKLLCDHFTSVTASHQTNLSPIKYRRIDEYHCHPGDRRDSKTKKTNCPVYYNLCYSRDTDDWYIARGPKEAHAHNHKPYDIDHVPRPASLQQKRLVENLTNASATLTSGQLGDVVNSQFPGQKLRPKQVSNLLQSLKLSSREQEISAGSDAAALVRELEKLKDEDPRWKYHMKLSEDGNNQLLAVFWQDPGMVELARQYGDIIINDIAALHNNKHMPLNIFTAIDNFYQNRNVAYCIQISESSEYHRWALQCLFESMLQPPDVFMSDLDTGLSSVLKNEYPNIFHLLCLHHISGNFARNLSSKLGAEFRPFLRDFWSTHHAESEDRFLSQFEELTRVCSGD